MFKKALMWGSVAFLLFFIAYKPSAASDVFGSLGGTLADIGRGFGGFFDDLFQ